MKTSLVRTAAKKPNQVALRFAKGKTTKLLEQKDGSAVLSLCVESLNKLTARGLRKCIRKAVQLTKEGEYASLVVDLKDLNLPTLAALSDAHKMNLLVEEAIIANFAFTQFKSKLEKQPLKELVIVGEVNAETREAVRRARIIGEEVNRCRVLANTPGGDMTPRVLATEAKRATEGTIVQLTILGEREMEREGMGAILGVARGSTEEPQFLILEYWGLGRPLDKEQKEEADYAPIVFAGKGITFDTGGLSLKPAESMNDMHLDMSGGAAVIHAVALAARLKLKKNIIGLVPAVENMPSGESYRPGDILRSLSGKTIEVLNTDAEGRIVLADTLTYAKRYNPRIVIDVATLTGAALVALGAHAHAIMSPDETFARKICALGEESGEYAWPLPLWSEYEQYITGSFGDFANIPATGNPRYAGAINGGMFLYQFAKDYPSSTIWAHIDMAPRMICAPGDHLAKGATGEPVRLLLKIAEKC
jgi:leucyl aminopeptidase